jgi:hypothetical protein
MRHEQNPPTPQVHDGDGVVPGTNSVEFGVLDALHEDCISGKNGVKIGLRVWGRLKISHAK